VQVCIRVAEIVFVLLAFPFLWWNFYCRRGVWTVCPQPLEQTSRRSSSKHVSVHQKAEGRRKARASMYSGGRGCFCAVSFPLSLMKLLLSSRSLDGVKSIAWGINHEETAIYQRILHSWRSHRTYWWFAITNQFCQPLAWP